MNEGISQRAYAKHRGCHHQAVREAIQAGRLSRSLTPDGRIADIAAADAEWEANTYADRRPLSGPAGRLDEDEAPSLGEARARLDAAKAELAEIELAEKKAELTPAADVEARLVNLFANCRTKLLGVPSRARQQDPALTNEQIALLESLMREALEDLSDTAGEESEDA